MEERNVENKNVQILSIEGKDLLIRNYRVEKNIFYKGSLDDSIEIDELNNLSKKIIKFNKNKGRYYSNDIITVTFKYACVSDKERDLTDEEYERISNLENTLKVLKQNKVNKKLIRNTQDLIRIARRNINKKMLREQLYQYGFYITINNKTEHFVRYKRSSGSARVGKCLFINDRYIKHMIDWSFANINHEEDTQMDCASMEAYISLPTSSCIGRFKLEPKNILLIEDGKSTFKDTVMATRLINEEKDKEGNIIGGDLDTNIEETYITNKIWDGESLLDKSIFDENGYSDKAILQVRNRFFKGIGINTNIQQFFKDNNIIKVSQLNGLTIAKNIEDIKLITTPNSVKYLKYGSFEKWLTQIVPNWGICKYEKEQHHFNNMAQTHYQLINTLGMDKETVKLFLNDTLKYINLLKTNTAVFKYHLGLNIPDEVDGELRNNIQNKMDFMLNMLEINDDFVNTRMCKDFRNEMVKNYINNTRRGHILVEGNYSVVVSSPIEYLKESIGMWDGSSLIQPGECVSSKFNVGEDILGVRSPQPTMCNMTVFRNNKYEELDKYFNTESKEVIFISAIGWNVFETQSSMDVDGDSMLLTNNKYTVDSAKKLEEKVSIGDKYIKRFLVSTDFTPKLNIKRQYNWKDLADTDIKCSSNKIGEIINLAQMLNSVYWDWKKKGVSEDKLLELYKDICQLNILSCIEIDRCKKLSPVDATKELNKIRQKKYLGKGKIIRNKQKKEVGIRPHFFKYLDGGKDYKFSKFNTGMDYLQEVITDFVKRKNINTFDIDIKYILVKQKSKKADRHGIDKIKKLVKEMKYKQQLIFKEDYDNKWEIYQEIHKEAINKVKKVKITPELIYTIFSRLNKSYIDNKYEEYKKIARRLLQVLYEADKVNFLKCIRIKTDNCSNIIKNEKGKIDLYGVKFTEIKSKSRQNLHTF